MTVKIEKEMNEPSAVLKGPRVAGNWNYEKGDTSIYKNVDFKKSSKSLIFLNVHGIVF